MFYFSRPAEQQIADFHRSALTAEYSYAERGSTISEHFTGGYTIDRNRIELGSGDAAFARARTAVRSWKMFDIGWIRIFDAHTPIEAGETATLLISHFGFYSLNSARIVYTIDEPTRFGFAYGTLTCHGEIGEERFSVEIDEGSGRVCYDILAMSRPGHMLAKLGYPLTRYLQRSFARDSLSAIRAAVTDM